MLMLCFVAAFLPNTSRIYTFIENQYVYTVFRVAMIPKSDITSLHELRGRKSEPTKQIIHQN